MKIFGFIEVIDIPKVFNGYGEETGKLLEKENS